MELIVTNVPVDDQQKALEFYTNVLGFKKKTDEPVGENRWLTVVGPDSTDGVELLLEPTENPTIDEELETYREALVTNGIPWTMFGCEDVEAEYERLSEQGVEFSQEPMTAGGVTLAVFDDTCGNLIQIMQQ
ncbi:VOC family protein [Natrinema gelatinilyticum]|uniref:VOC family protein n=1 Tax=Natrinema gelatinilyticum TaxID=2961571 RepID=UPI0020C4AC96|nr:VOC family protein [Natrinema gelatinilyticum]